MKWKYRLQRSHETKTFSPTGSFKWNYSFHSTPTLCLRLSIPAACASSFHAPVFSFLLLLPLHRGILFSFVLFLGFHFVFLLQCYSLYFYFLMLIFSLTLRYSFLYQFGVTDKLTNLCHTAIEHMPQRRDGRWLGRFLGKLTLELIPKGPKFTVVNQAEKRAWRWGEYSKGRK